MARDVKIEVLYFKTLTDISLEFGLHGNYPLRILSSNCNDIDSFFRALKRAVQRSEIILTVGGYKDDEYLPEFIAKAIGKKCFKPDLRKENIIGSQGYSIPDGAVPIAPKSRLFGGFLIESGPQTIISLVDDRKVRLDIVKELVVDYITEHHNAYNQPFGVKMGTKPIEEQKTEEFSDISSYSENDVNENPELPTFDSNDEVFDTTTPVETPADMFENVDTSAEKAPLEAEEISYSTEEVEVNNEPETEAVQDEALDQNGNEAETAILPLFNDVEVVEQDDVNIDGIDDNVVDDELLDEEDNYDDDSDEYYCEDYFFEKHRTRRKKRIVRLLCIIFSILIILGMVFGKFAYFDPTSATPKDFYDSLNSLYYSKNGDISAGFNIIKKQQSTCFAWLKSVKLKLDHPVFSVSDTDNASLLNQLPNGMSDTRGTLFCSALGSVSTVHENITVYGSGSLGGLFDELSSEINTAPKNVVGSELTASDNRFVTNWQVFSVFTHSSADGYDYCKAQFDDDEQYAEHLSKLQQMSFEQFEHEFFGKEQLLILVAIDGNERYVAVAYLKSIRILSALGNHSDISNTSNSSSTTVSDGNSSVSLPSEPTVGEAEGDDDYHGDQPDIVLPLPPFSGNSSSTTSSTTSSATSSVNSSTVSSSTVSSSSEAESSSSESSSTVSSNASSVTSSESSSVTSSENTSTEASSTTSSSASSSVTSSEPSTSVDSSIGSSSESVSSAVSSNTSSTTSSETEKPSVDPIFTWDVELACRDNADGTLYIGSAIEIVAMIIEDEMSPTIDPPEALIAQAIVKYNWLINNNGLNSAKAPSNALDPNPTKQAIQYATAAKGNVLMYGNTLAKTYCHAYSAGKTACYQDVWSGTTYPYLQSVDCPVDENLKDFKTSTTYTAEKIKSIINNVCGIDVSEMDKPEWLKPIKFDANNLYCTKISIGGKEYHGKYLRDTLLAKKNTGVSAIRSTAYEIVYNEEDDTFTVTCKGYGHGVGFSQRGAKAYALQGWTHEQLLTHFFPGTTLVKN